MNSLDVAFQGGAEKVADEALNLAAESQKVLKKSVNAILPVMLCLGGFGTIVYRLVALDGYDVVTNFLIMVFVQLMPMAALKLKTWICSDRVSLMPSALVKTLLMHIAVQVFRIMHHIWCYSIGSRGLAACWQHAFDYLAFAVATYILINEFGFKFNGLTSFADEHKDVLTCIVAGCLMSIIVNVIAPPFGGPTRVVYIINDFGNYMECLAFVPVVRIVCLENAVEEHTPGANVGELDRNKAKAFMAFILGYYLWDDIVFSVGMAEKPIVAAPKAAHFVMLMDFAFYFVMKVGAQPKIVDDILPNILPAAVLQEVMTQEDDAEKGFVCDEQKGLLGEEEDDDSL